MKRIKRLLALLLALTLVASNVAFATDGTGDTSINEVVETPIATYDVNFMVSQGAGGSISVGEQTVTDTFTKTLNSGDNLEFVLTADAGYEVDTVKVNDSAIVPITGTTYRVDNIIESKSIAVSFKEVPKAEAPVIQEEQTALLGETALEETTPEETSSYTLQVYFQFEDGTQASTMYNAQYQAGQTYEVPVKPLAGYKATVGGIEVTDANLTGIVNVDTTIEVVYVAQDTTYTVNHYVQNLSGTYDLTAETLTAKVGTVTTAVAKTLDGYTSTVFSQKTIVADETITIDIYYNLVKFYINFNSNGGSYVSRVIANYGEVYDIPATDPTKTGYTFGGWYDNSALTGVAVTGAKTVTANITYYAKWNPITTGYTVVYWVEKVTTGQYDYKETVAKTALVGSMVSGEGDKSYTYFSYDPVATDKNVVVKADGSTVVNVYYSRNTYTFIFNINNLWANLNINGSTYTGSNYSFRAKLGQDISTLWPTSGNVSPQTQIRRFFSWTDGTNNYGTKRFTITEQLITNTAQNATQTFTGVWRDDLQPSTVKYFLENANDTGYTEATQYSQSINLAGELLPKQIEGFTYSYTANGSGYQFYYTRNKYNLEFSNGGSIIAAKTEAIKMDANISGKNFTPTRPAVLPSYYQFMGWYTTPQGYESSVYNFLDAKMPMSNLILYAKWVAPIYDVAFNTDSGTVVDTQKVTAGKNAVIPSEPTKSGYQFEGWYTNSTFKTEYDFAAPVLGNIIIYAKFTQIRETTYTINYKLSDGTDLYPPQTIKGTVGDTVYAKALTNVVYVVNKVKASLILNFDKTKNVITFTYSIPTTIYYKVIYQKADGTILKSDAPQSTNQSQIIVPGVAPDGYATTVSKITKVLENETTPESVTNNIITFQCSPITYSIAYNLNGGSVLGTNPTSYTVESNEMTLINPTKVGYIFEGWSGTGLLGNANLNVLIPTGSTKNRSYTAHWIPRSDITYQVTYKDSTGKVLYTTKNVTDQIMNTMVTETAESIVGYTPDAATKSLTLQVDNNIIDFVYTLNDQTYTVKYIDEDTNKEIATANSFATKYGDIITGSNKKIAIANYTFTSATNLTVGSDNATNIITVYYSVDKIGAQNPDEPDTVPDKYQIMFTYLAGSNGTVSGITREVVNRAGLTIDGGAFPHASVMATADGGSYYVNWMAEEQVYSDVQAVRAASFTKNTTFIANFCQNHSLTITADSASQTYNGQTLTAPGYSAVGLQAGDYITGITATGSQTNAGSSNSSIAGTPIIRDASGNDVTYRYNIETAVGALTVTTKNIILTAEDGSKVYGQTDPILTATAEGVVTGDSLDYTVSRATGEDAGTYVVNATLGSNPNYNITVAQGTFVIEKKKIGVTVTADDKTKVYGDSDPQLTANIMGLVGTDTLNYTLSRETGEGVGSYRINATIGVNKNYEVETVKAGTFTITPKTVSLIVNNELKTYGEADPALTAMVTGLVGNDTLDYTISRTSGENAGTYNITAEVVNNPNYIVAITNGTLTISKKQVDVVVAANGASKVYGEIDPVLTANVTGTVGTDELKYTITRSQGENAGTYDIIVTPLDNPNYEVGTVMGSFVITPKPITIAAEDKNITYGETDPKLTAVVTGLETGDTLNYSLNREAGTDTGIYDITVALGSNPNYAVVATDATLTIGKKAVTIVAENRSKIYGETDPTLTAVVSGLVGNDTLDYTLARGQGEEAGTYPITVAFEENKNYEITTEPAIFTIAKKVIGVQLFIQDTNKTYGETDPELTAAILGLEEGDTLNYTVSRVAGEQVGTYAITAIIGDNKNYDVQSVTEGTFTITKKDVTVAANDNNKIYGEADPELSATVTGTQPGDALDYTVIRAEGEHAGDYTMTVVPGSNPNYNITTTPGTFTIEKKSIDVSVTAQDTEKVYGEADPELTAVVTGLVGTDTLAYSLNREAGEGVGTYPIQVILGENPDYEVAVTDGTFTITKKTVTVSLGSSSKIYGEADPDLTPTITGLEAGDTLDYTIIRTPGEHAGEYTVSVVLGSNPDYDVTVEDGTLTIEKKTFTLTVDNNSKTYGDADPVLTAVTADLVGSDTLDYTILRETGENAGSYGITATFPEGANPDYDITVVDGSFTISPKEVDVTIVADNQTKTYGEADPTLTAQINGMVGEDELNFTMSREPGEGAGTYDIYVNLGDNPNYIVAKTEGTFTITKKDVTVAANDNNKIYGEADPELSATVTGTQPGDALDYTVIRAEGEHAGDYTMTVVPGSNPNYNITTTPGTFTIKKKSIDVSVTAQNAGKVYGDADPELTAVVTGMVGDDIMNFTLSREPGENSGTYPIHVALGDNPDYEISTVESTFSIVKKVIDVQVLAQNSSKTYGEKDPVFIATVLGLKAGDILNYTLSREPGEHAGTYAIHVAIGENVNYDVETIEDASLVILPKAITLTAINSSKIIGAADPALAATIAGLVGADSLNYTINRVAGEIAGTYTIHIAYLKNDDYAVRVVDALFTILLAPETPAIPAKIPASPPRTSTITITEEAVSLSNIDTESKGYKLTEVPEENVPLAKTDSNEHKCCILHFLIILLALAVELCYTRSMKKRQTRIMELREKVELSKKSRNE